MRYGKSQITHFYNMTKELINSCQFFEFLPCAYKSEEGYLKLTLFLVPQFHQFLLAQIGDELNKTVAGVRTSDPVVHRPPTQRWALRELTDVTYLRAR